MYPALLTVLFAVILSLVAGGVACGQEEPTRTRIRPEPVGLRATVDAAVAATRAVERTREAVLPTGAPEPTATAVATPVPTPEPYLVGEGDVERGLRVLLDCVASNPHWLAWFADMMVEQGYDPERARRMAEILLSGGAFSESLFLEFAEEEPAFKVILAAYAKMDSGICEPGEELDSSVDGVFDLDLAREVFGTLYDCLEAAPELRSSFLDGQSSPGLEFVMEDRDLFVDFFVLASLSSELPGAFVSELEWGLLEICS